MTSSNLSILVLDPDKDIRFFVRVALRNYDIRILESAELKNFKETVRLEKPSIIILNYIINGISGYELADEIMTWVDSYRPKIIIMTLEGFDLIAKHPNVDDYLAKPFSSEQLKNVLAANMGECPLASYEKKEPSAAVVKKPAEKPAYGRRKSILLADDERSIVKLLEVMLSSDYEFEYAYDGAELVEKASQKDFDLIISDVVMPKLSGWKSVKAIRETGCMTPVIFNSGYVKDKELYETLKPSGKSAFMLKPFKKAELLDLVKELID